MQKMTIQNVQSSLPLSPQGSASSWTTQYVIVFVVPSAFVASLFLNNAFENVELCTFCFNTSIVVVLSPSVAASWPCCCKLELLVVLS